MAGFEMRGDQIFGEVFDLSAGKGGTSVTIRVVAAGEDSTMKVGKDHNGLC